MVRGVLVFLFVSVARGAYEGLSETRQILSLDGVWRCYCEKGPEPLAYFEQGGLRKVNESAMIAVPGDYVDMADEIDLKSCRSVVWYERSFFVPTSWKQDQKIWLRLDGVLAETELWLNGIRAGQEQTSEIPIKHDITERLLFDAENQIALSTKNAKTFGIPYSISLRAVPEMLFIQDVSLNTTVVNGTGIITYNVTASGLLQVNRNCITVQVLDRSGCQVALNMTCDPLQGSVMIPNCNLWWPTCMDSNAGYLYTLVFRLHYKFCDSATRDVYRKKVGFRSLSWSDNSFNINGRMSYLHGVETSRDWTAGLKDATLLKWLNANTFVTSSPPSEGILDIADELGLMVVLGSPLRGLREVVSRYRSHPSVVLWLIVKGDDGNSTLSRQCEVSAIDSAKALDSTRPFTAIASMSRGNPQLMDKLDIVSMGVEDISLNSSLLLMKKPILVTYGSMFLSEGNVIRSLNYNPYRKFDRLQRCLDGLRRNVSIVGEFFGNFLAYKRLHDTQGDDLVLVSGIFNRNREPTLFADFIRFKFKEKRTPYAYRQPWCKYAKKYRRRVDR